VCTLIFAWQVFEDAPLLVAANRDEQLDRPSQPPAWRNWEADVLAPKDEQADGTWMGINEHEVFVGLTNRWLDDDIEGERSRGLLVRDALRAESATQAVRMVERELDARTYDGFFLVAADRNGAFLVEAGPTRHVAPLEPGVHIVVNVGADGQYVIPERLESVGREQAANADTIMTAVRPEPGEHPEAWLDRTARMLGDHDYGVCIHRDGFGTRSASLVAVTDDGMRYEYAPGPPCETAFDVVS
jgi:uncharacterized protein with NRDE domain